MKTTETRFHVSGIDCPTCAAKMEDVLRGTDGVRAATFNVASAMLTVEHDPARADAAALRRTVHELGYRVEGLATDGGWLDRHGPWLMVAVSGAALAVALSLNGAARIGWLPLPRLLSLGGERVVTPATLFYALGIVAGGFGIVRRAIRALRHGTFDINLLMALAAVGAGIVWEWAEGASAMFLFALALRIESYTMGRARRAIESLMSLQPATARVRRDGEVVDLAADQVIVGDVVIVRAGETIPVDGEVVSGASEVNQAPVTGESAPVGKAPGDEVFSGTVNQHAVLDVRATRPASDSTLARVLHLVEEAEASRSPAQQFVQRFARWYTPAVIVGAILTAALPPLLWGASWQSWLFRSLVLLVIACPCALVISTPVSVVSALAAAARRGILIKGGVHLENLARVQTVLLDKTGTLTEGVFAVASVEPLGEASASAVLGLAATVEAHNEHLIGRAIRDAAAQRGLAWTEPEGSKSQPGRGAEATVDGTVCRVGNLAMFDELGLLTEAARDRAAELERSGATAVLVSRGDQLEGIIGLSDRVRAGAAQAVASLRAMGVEEIGMLTGDNAATAEAVGRAVGIDDVHAGLLPADKLATVHRVRQRGGTTAFVGDGVNDAPALAASTVGIAMGVAGTDVALETADVALMADELERVSEAVALSRRTVRIIRQNVAIALGLKAVFFALALANVATLWMAVVADMGASLLVIANALRLLRGTGRRPV